MKQRVLIVDDERNMRWALRKTLTKDIYEVYEAEDGEQAIEQYKKIEPHLILLDIKMPKKSGLQVLKEIKSKNKKIPIIMITAYGDVESALHAMKIGAIDYITKPFDIEELKLLIKKTLKYKNLEDEVEILREERLKNNGIIGQSSKMIEVLEMVQRVANSTATVLVQGESGTGKELIARAVHELSDRKLKPFIGVNCGALPETLLDSELFGHEKGAFTGAISRKLGRFERAQGGTLFLDEIGELSLLTQVKLLRAIQEKEIERVGGSHTISVDARIIAATNRDLEKMVAEGSFREDLYYRLKVIPIQLPALRERKEDIPVLVQYFINKFAKHTNKKVLKVSDISLKLLERYSWPGNIRELQNVIERAVILCWGETLTPEVLPKELIDSPHQDVDANVVTDFILPEEGISLDNVEKNFIQQALERTNGNQTHAAKLLGISRHTLLYRMSKYQISEQ